VMQGKILVCIFMLICAVLADEAPPDEFYCKMKKDNWQVCRTCNDTNLDCDGVSLSNECKCDGIKIAKKDSYEGYGGIDHCEKEGWCFVKQSREDPPVCSDQEWHFDNERFTTDPDQAGSPYIWLKPGTEYAKSKMACDGKQHNIGNEEMLQDMKITTDFLKNVAYVDDNGIEHLEENMTFDMELPEECKQECESRYQCGAWSYDTEELKCHLHTVDSCCGQFDKREPVSGFISGYVCKSCWSTRGECPCPAGERFRKVGTAHSTGGQPVMHVNPTGLGSVGVTRLNLDVCACEYRSPTKARPLTPRCVKPLCKSAIINPHGLCENEARCRKTCPAKAKYCGPAPAPEPES